MEAAFITLRRVGLPPDEFARLRACPAIDLDEILDGARGLVRMTRHHSLDVACDVEELRFAGEERRDHYFVGSVEGAWHRAGFVERLVCEPETREAIHVGLLKREHAAFRKRERLE